MLTQRLRALAWALPLYSLVASAANPPLEAPPKAPNSNAPSITRASIRGLFNGAPTETLTLRQAIDLALRNNLEARFDHISIRLEQAKVRFEAGVFDPVFSIQTSRESLRRPENANDVTRSEQVLQSRQIAAINNNTNVARIANGLPPLSTDDSTVGINSVIFDQQNDRSSASLVQKTPWGMRFGFFVEANQLRNTFSADTREVFPEYQTSTQVQVVQPLLKDFGPAANLANVRAARISKRIAVLAWKQKVMSSVQAVMGTYYEMIFGLADIGVRQDAIAADEKLVQYNQRRVEVGFTQPFDVQQARAQVSSDQEALLSAKNVLLERQFALKRLVLAQFELNDARVYLPATEPNLAVPILNRSVFLQQAFANRPDFQSALAEADSQDIRLRYARNQLLPQLDLVGTYGLNGLTGDFNSSFDQGFKGHTPGWSVGLNLRIPLGNIQARAQLDSVKAQKEQAIIRIKQSELSIGVDVDTVISRIETNQQRLETARKTRELYQEAVRIALRRLEEGQISSFDMIEQQRRLYDAKSREAAARTELNKSITQMWLATGTVLDKLGLQVPDEK